jgi:hypothetical protein
MKYKCITAPLLLMALFLAVTPTAAASTTRYVNGVTGSDSNNCLSPTTACKTIGHAISVAAAGDTIRVGPATYAENLTIGISLTLIGAGAATTIIDGRGVNIVVTVSNANAHVSISSVTIRNGSGRPGGGVFNNGILTVNNCTVSGNIARGTASGGLGGGIDNGGTLKVNNSTIAGNQVSGVFGAGFGGGIGNSGTAIVTNSTISGNTSSGWGGGIGNLGGNVSINNTTIAGNKEIYSYGGVANYSGTLTLQNSITANNSRGDCYTRVAINSEGYNLSSDGTCAFSGPGDKNNVDPMLGPLQNNGGPTQTMALPSGSPAVDAGNPTGCTDGLGHLLKTDQRGKPRPDAEDTAGCDIGAYERQSD